MKDKVIQIVLKGDKPQDTEIAGYLEERYKHLTMKALFIELIKRDMEEKRK